MYKTLVFCLIFGVFSFTGLNADCETASKTTVSGRFAPTGKICPGDLIFDEHFDELNMQIWQHEKTLSGGGNSEFQWYLNNRSNTYVEDSILFIKPTIVADDTGNNYLYSGTLDIWGGSPEDQCTNPQFDGCKRTGNKDNILNPVKSARLRTMDSFHFKYGKLEAKAKLPSGDWLWPSIWLLPRWNLYSGWPASGEIDLFESRGNKNLVNSQGVNIGIQQIGSTLHWGPNYNYDKFLLTHFQKQNDSGFDADFHYYQLEWTPEYIKFSLDYVELGTITPPDGGFWELGDLDKTGLDNPWKRSSKMAPFDQEFYIIINLAVGGTTYFPDNDSNPGGKPWLNNSTRPAADFWEGKDQWLPTWNLPSDSSALQVDYVRVWAL